MRAFTFGLFVAGLLACGGCPAAEWQWSVSVDSVISGETKKSPRAFLWIPPNCERVRAVVVGQHNMEEEGILEHPKFREMLTSLGFAEVWVTPGLDLGFRFDQGAGEHFDEMMRALATESGYSELAQAPVVPVGHSAAASYPANFGTWNPGRTLAALSVSGQWPYIADKNGPDKGTRTLDGVPVLTTIGEYEWADERIGEGLKEFAEHPGTPMTMLAEPAGGHFDCSDAKVEYLALYLKKAAFYRLPEKESVEGAVVLRPIDPTKQGWLVDRWRKNEPPKFPAASVVQYTGDRKEAFWCFDEEMAKATENFGAIYRRKKADLLGYMQNGAVVPQVNGTHQQVTLPFLPIDDGLTFKLTGVFLDKVPDGRPAKWTGQPAGTAITHAEGGGPVVISRICGPVQKLSEDTFAIRFYRMGMDNPKRSNDIWLMASHPGDENYKRAVQQAQLRFPLRNTVGDDQKIDFPKIEDQPAGTASVPLAATSTAKVPVYYYVREGPAEVEGNQLRLTTLPPRSKFPVKVTVVAWQWGRSIDPKLKSADPVEQTFFIRK